MPPWDPQPDFSPNSSQAQTKAGSGTTPPGQWHNRKGEIDNQRMPRTHFGNSRGQQQAHPPSDRKGGVKGLKACSPCKRWVAPALRKPALRDQNRQAGSKKVVWRRRKMSWLPRNVIEASHGSS
ncbi:Hypothetical protein FKW44_016265 [Caligus rogercresseyi]|uniref:Uncharacterized protein n=1 Tax=Caligus rogercresseyi TaxID=217165 RepID=A0A7T8H1H6_CALRO|nr:Hypothetical protein FKW44_016265 [Caligus rogercresseyi]